METEIFTCKYFKFGRNTCTTGLSQSHVRNFLPCSITTEIIILCEVLDNNTHVALVKKIIILMF